MTRGVFERIYDAARRVPEGRVATYGQLALMAGLPRGGRTAGWAMRCAPPDVPAHRVVSRTGALSPEEAFGGAQRAMLEAEGIGFLKNGRIDMRGCIWNPEEENK